MNSPCPPATRFVITQTKTAVEPYIFTVERFGATGAPPIKTRCMGQHELRGYLHGAGVEANTIERVIRELESGSRSEVETREV